MKVSISFFTSEKMSASFWEVFADFFGIRKWDYEIIFGVPDMDTSSHTS